MKTFLLTFLAAATLLPALSAADISGAWTIAGDVVGNQLNMRCTFKQDGANLTGTCGGDVTTGSVADGKVTFSHVVNRGQDFELTYTGTLNSAGTSIKGAVEVMGVSGEFTATKDDTAAAPASAASGTDFAGNWTFTGDVVGNAINMKCTFKRAGDKFSGTCTYSGMGDSPTAGSVAGSQVTFQNPAQADQVYQLTYTGTLDAAGSSMKGEIAVAGVSGTFSGTKDK
jgi:hypothetical protein